VLPWPSRGAGMEQAVRVIYGGPRERLWRRNGFRREQLFLEKPSA
jgi:hypothetical protein